MNNAQSNDMPAMSSQVPWPAPVNITYTYDGCFLMQSVDGGAVEHSPMHQLYNEPNVPPAFDYEPTLPLRTTANKLMCVQTK